MAKMNPEIKAKWVEALRSGKYVQGRGQLKTLTEAYCCLGVLCHVLDPEEERWKEWLDVLPRSICDEAGLEELDPVLGHSKLGTALGATHYNDVEGYSFAQIADLIEEHL